MRRRPWTAGLTGLAVVAVTATAATVLTPTTAQAHGAPSAPGSRTYLCFQDAHWTGGDLEARNAACQQAIAEGGKQPLWDWYGVGNGGAAGRARGYIPDGKLCSGDNPTYAAFDTPRADWPATHLTSGAEWTYRFPTIDGHPGYFDLYITKDSYDPTKPLTWDDLEEMPFSHFAADTPNEPGEFVWDVTLPEGKSGRHLIYNVWQRTDSDGAFFNCSDVVFDGGNGEISGYPNDNEWIPPADPTGTPTDPTDTPTDPTGTPTDPAAPTPTGTSTGTPTATPTDPTTGPAEPTGTPTDPTPTDPGTSPRCTAAVQVQHWSGGYLAEVTVLNRGGYLMPWTVTAQLAPGDSLLSGWNAEVSLSGTTLTATAPNWNPSLSEGEEIAIGLVATGSGDPTQIAVNGEECAISGATTE
jgi:predicted carbohydrate-binding protein with CBM5 and CBM33 domain